MQMGRLALTVTLLSLGAMTTGCDDPVPPSAQGAVKYRLGRQPTGPICQMTSPSENLGSISIDDLSKTSPLVDGEGDSKVTCSIRPSGSNYNVSASISQGKNSIAISGTITPGTPSNFTVGIVSDNLKASYSSDADKPCQFVVDGDSPAGLGVSPGKLRAFFSCTDMIHSGAPTDEGRCAIAGATKDEPGGYIFLNDCDE